MKIIEYVPGALLVLGVPSRSGGPGHLVTIVYDDNGAVREVSCTCKGFEYRLRCHHVEEARALMEPMPPKPSNIEELLTGAT